MPNNPIIPFDYLEREKRRSPPQQDNDPVSQAISIMHQEQVRSTILQSPDASTTAMATRVAREAGEPPALIDGRVAEVAKAQQADRFTRVLGQYPAFTNWAIQNPRDAVAASGDHKPLGIIGTAWKMFKETYNPVLAFAAGWDQFDRTDVGSNTNSVAAPVFAMTAAMMGDKEAQKALPSFRKAGQAFASGIPTLGRWVTSPLAWLADVSDVSRSQNTFLTADKYLADTSKAWMPKSDNWVTDQVLGGIANTPGTIASLSGAMGARALGASVSEAAIASVLPPSLQQGGESYFKARDQGVGKATATLYGMLDTAAEAGGEYLASKAFIKSSEAGDSIIQRWIKEQIPDLLGEEATTVAENTTAWLFLPENRDKTIGQLAAEMPESMAATAIQTLVGGGLANVTIGGLEKTLGTMAEQRRQEVGDKIAPDVMRAWRALQERNLFDSVEKAAAEASYRKIDPEGYANMIGYVAGHEGVEQVFLNPEAVRAYQQSDSYDQYEDPFAPYQAKIDEALATGGDVVLPAGFALGTLPGTAAWSAVKDDMRLQPGGMSAREADEFNARMDDVIKELSDQRAQIDQGQAKERDARSALVERVTQMLQDAGFTPTNANLQAELIAQRAAVRAARLGRELQPGDFDTRIVSVLPPALAEMQKADRLDLVINAMRKGKSATSQGGKSLLEWIAARGGINDTGGDIASMGGDKWHMRPAGEGKDKRGRAKKPTPIAGRSKLIRDYDPRQAAMGGISGEGDYGIDSTMRAAVEAGYFPHLAGENVQSLDTNEMLAAIRDELEGNPVYAEQAKVDDVRLAADELNQMLADRGLDPEGMSDAEIRKAVRSQIEEAKASGRELYQSLDDGARGRITLPVNGWGTGQATIELFQSRNPSTLIHELSHQWLEELRHDAGLPDAPEQLKADWQTVQDWFKANGHAIGDEGAIPTEAHELWARGGERYLMEGKAPSPALSRLFETLRSWMVSVYRTVQALRAPITPEIREVFDRLVATDEEIRQAEEQLRMQPLFKDPASIGMTGDEFAAYTRQVEGARDEANATLLQKAMAAIRRQRTKSYNDERKAVWQDEAERLDNSPILKSLRLMRETPLSLEWLQDRMGQDVTDLLPKRVPPLWREGGANPDAVAEMAGFDSGQNMIEVLIGAERQHRQKREGGDQRTLRARMIDNAADAEMRRRHGDDPFSDGSIEQEAIAAVNGELAGELLATEIRALSRRTGQRPTPYKIARDWARERVRRGTVSEEAMPGALQRHTRAVAKAGREAEEAMLKGDMPAALAAKQRQMLSSALLAEAKAAHDEVMAARDRMANVAKNRTMKSVDQDYLDQAHALLDAVDLGPRSQRSIERQGKWEQWAAAREAEGYDVVVPPSFEATIGRTHWSRLSVENLLGLNDVVKQVMHLGRLKQTLLDNQEQREWNEVFDEAVTAAGNIDGPPPADLASPGFFESIGNGLAFLDSALLKMETVFDWLDGGNPNGVFNRIAFRSLADAQAREQDMLKDYFARIRARFEAVPQQVLARWHDKITLPFIDRFTERPMRMDRQQIIAMALNIGNEGNLQRLSDGYRINAAALEQYLNDTLTAEEWQFVQGVWDDINTLWPEMEALEKRVNGVSSEKIEPRAFVTPHGPMRGGYFPAIYDATRDRRAEEDADKASDLLGSKSARATTRASATKERAEKVDRPLSFDLGNINRHLGEVIHDLTHREALIQSWRFLTNPRVTAAVDAALGRAITGQFKPWLRSIARSWESDRAGNEGFAKIIRRARTNATIVGMGFRATTIISQIGGYLNTIEVVGFGPWSNAMAMFAKNPAKVWRMVVEKSPEVRQRMETLDRDINTEITRLAATNPASKLAAKVIEGKQFAFHFIGLMDRVVSIPTWLAGYNNAISAGMSDEDAVYAGDKAVRQSQGAGGPKDLAAVQRGTGKLGEAGKLLTMYYSFNSMSYQRTRTLARDIGGSDDRRKRVTPRLMARATVLLVMVPLMNELLRGLAGGNAGPDDDEWWAQWFLRKTLANALAPIPGVRDVFEPYWNQVRGAGFGGASFTPVQRAYDSVGSAARDVGELVRGEQTKHATKDVLEAVGYSTGVVPGQVASSTQFIVDWANGDVDPKTPGEVLEGISTGKIKE